MTNKEVILETIKFLKPKSGHINLPETLWKKLEIDEERQSELRDILLTGELINLGMPDQWTMQLTARAILLKPEQLNEDGSIRAEVLLRNQKSRIDELQIENLQLQNLHLRRKIPYAIIGFIGGIVSAVIVFYATNQNPKKPQPTPNEIHLHIEKEYLQDSTYQIGLDTLRTKTANK